MIKSFIHIDVKKLTALALFGVLVFSFLHSELDFLNYDNSNHDAHDFCQIVKGTSVNTKIVHNVLPKLEFNKDICAHCINTANEKVIINSLATTDEHQIFRKSTELYLYKKTFLI